MSQSGEFNCFMQAFGELLTELSEPYNNVPAAFYRIIPVADPQTDMIEIKGGKKFQFHLKQWLTY